MFYKKSQKITTIILFLLPSLLGLLLFSLIPIGSSLYLSLSEWDVIGGQPQFIKLENYSNILKSEEFWRVLKNTSYFITLYIPLILIVSVTVGMLLNFKYKGIAIYRTLFFIPVLTSWVAGALIWRWVLSPEYGVVNALLGYIGIKGPGWLYDKTWAMPGIVLASIWKDTGFFGLIMLAGLQGIDSTYYEAAEIDGASNWEKFRKITLPLLSPTIFFVTVISIINSFQLFPQVMVMVLERNFAPTHVFVERIYLYAFKYYKMGYATAFSWLLFLMIFIVTMLQLKLQKRWVNYDT
ncbi:MAG TPA: sugar ABC transporter permease [Firmicutes bacterium]|jgi:multiple sugar transport system permease protein|nr:sugar ABC transporter permease [Bacillota bacterium]HBT16000.1 sugar ABC transporter permease [Bacillota bacterium]